MTLANLLRTDSHIHRALPQDSELAQAIAVLARAHQDATWRRTRASNELRSLLREYFPNFLKAFAGKTTNLTRADARAVLAIAPTPAKATTLFQGSYRGRAATSRSLPGHCESPRVSWRLGFHDNGRCHAVW
jgi:hypothetical protein